LKLVIPTQLGPIIRTFEFLAIFSISSWIFTSSLTPVSAKPAVSMMIPLAPFFTESFTV